MQKITSRIQFAEKKAHLAMMEVRRLKKMNDLNEEAKFNRLELGNRRLHTIKETFFEN